VHLAVLGIEAHRAGPHHTSAVTEPRLFRVILPVSDIEAAASFYADVLGMPGDRVSPGRHYFPCGGTILACYDALADGDPEPFGPNPQHIYFSVDDLEAAYERVRRRSGRDIATHREQTLARAQLLRKRSLRQSHLLRGLRDALYPQQRLARPIAEATSGDIAERWPSRTSLRLDVDWSCHVELVRGLGRSIRGVVGWRDC